MSPRVNGSASKYASAISTEPRLHDSIDRVCEHISSHLKDTVDLVVIFASDAYSNLWDSLASEVSRRTDANHIVGCSGSGIIGNQLEIEEGPALSIWAAHLPHVEIETFRLDFHPSDDGGAFTGWPDRLIHHWPDDGSLLLLAEPFSFPADYLLEQINEEHPGFPIIGGIASGGTSPGHNRLFIGDDPFESGAVACMIRGDVEVTSIVSQGCRPIGEKYVVTAAEGNLIYQLGGRPALEQLQQVFRQLPTQEQQLVQQALHIGRVVSEYQDDYEIGDFLVRNVLGVDRDSGVIAVGDFIRPGNTVQFHIREAEAASNELQQLLARHADHATAHAALLFTCNGRGSRLFPQHNHDAMMVAQRLGNIPLAGFFAQGEIGPVGGVSFLHGFTASLAIFS